MKNSDISPIILRPWPIPLVTNNDGRVQLAESNFPAYRTKIYGGQHIQIHQKFGWNFRFFKIFWLGHKILWLGNPPSLWISYLITGNLWKNYYFPLGYLLLPHFHLPANSFDAFNLVIGLLEALMLANFLFLWAQVALWQSRLPLLRWVAMADRDGSAASPVPSSKCSETHSVI